ncbi:MAG: hypothetical protein ABF248_04655 [Yoonia sp.]
MRIIANIAIIGLLSACSGNPLANLPKLSDFSLGQDAVSVALAEALDDAPEQDTSEADTALIEDAVAAEKSAEAENNAPEERGNWFSNLFAGSNKKTVVPSVDLPVDEATPEDDVSDTPTPDVLGVTADLDAPVAVPAPARAGFFGRLFGGGGTSDGVEPTPAAITTNEPAREGLFASLTPERTGPDAELVTVGTQVGFGEIATNCEVAKRQMGTKIDSEGGYTVYDTIPNATSLRTQYITGFKDRCARQFTAATTMLGDIGTHEVVRYLPSNKKMAYSETDLAYERIKNVFCGVKQGQPCGAKLDRLAKNTTFITAYRNFGSNPTWVNILLHKGEVIAISESKR